ncbi:MAG: tRNA (guanosine(46)-N7)-methyltransferase TrmB [Propionibacteriaceae bacterium]
MTEQRPNRQILSFVRRSTRMNSSQEKAWTQLRHYLVEIPRDDTDTSVSPAAAELDFPKIFGRNAPLYVEVGSGNGDSPVAFAAAHRDCNVVAFEVYEPSVASTMGKADRAGVENLRIIIADGVAGMEHLIPTSSIQELRTFFPDPWQKNRHHKRRLVNPAFVNVVARCLTPGGRWLIATDWEEYAEHTLEILGNDPRFRGGICERDPERPLTKYESRGIAQGRKILDLAWELVQQ